MWQFRWQHWLGTRKFMEILHIYLKCCHQVVAPPSVDATLGFPLNDSNMVLVSQVQVQTD